MNKSSIKRFSLLGLVLFAASAVTAALVSNTKSEDSKLVANGSLTRSSDGRDSCTATNGSFGQACFNTNTWGNSSGITTVITENFIYISIEASTVGDVAD